MADAIAVIVMAGCVATPAPCIAESVPVKVGILHSLTGAMAISENSIVDTELLAIEEINAKGGLPGRRTRPIIADGKSVLPTFVREAERLFTQENVALIFGCFTSTIRKTFAPVIIEKHGQLLVYQIPRPDAEAPKHLRVRLRFLPKFWTTHDRLGFDHRLDYF